MISVAKRTIQLIRLLFVTGLLLSIPLIANAQHAAAASMMEHSIDSSDMQTNCTAYCARTGGVPPHEMILNREEIRTPDPTPAEYEPYYLQFQKNYAPKKLHSYVYGSYSIRPPDIISLTGNYRF